MFKGLGLGSGTYVLRLQIAACAFVLQWLIATHKALSPELSHGSDTISPTIL